MTFSDFCIANDKEIKQLIKLKLPLKKSTEKLILSLPTSKQTEYYMIIQSWRGKIIERTFAARLNRKGIPEYQEVQRRVEGNSVVGERNIYIGKMCGVRTVWKETKPSYYMFSEVDRDKWHAMSNINCCKIYRAKYLSTLDDLINLDPSLRYCAWPTNWDVIEYVTIYRKYPEVEMLAKLGLYKPMFNAQFLKKLKDKSFKKYLYWCGVRDSWATGRDILKGYKLNKKLPDIWYENERDLMVKSVLENYPLDPVKLTKYFDKYYQEHGTHICVHSYKDMLEAEQYFHLDLSIEKNAFPHDFQKWHDHYTKQMKISLNRDIDIKIDEQAKRFKKLEKSFEGIALILPHCTQEFIDEGDKLHHCVGRMGYNKKMAKGESLILFVRKQDELNVPFVTMEYDPKKKKILQLYTDHDQTPEERVKDIIYNKWLPKVKRLKFA